MQIYDDLRYFYFSPFLFYLASTKVDSRVKSYFMIMSLNLNANSDASWGNAENGKSFSAGIIL